MKTVIPFRFILSLFLVMVLSLAAGCRSGRSGAGGVGGGEDYIDPLDVDNYALAARGDFGNPITDVQFDNVLFGYDSFQIPASERRKIEAVADFLLETPAATVLIDGHCDERGSREYNLSLGEHRALAVRAVMISLGVSGDRIHTRSFGSEQPLDPRSTEAAWTQNRRGEFSLYRQ